MRFKRFLSAALAAALTAGLLTLPATAAPASSFRDLSDPATMEYAEFLRLMGVVDGVGEGLFNPTGTLTRGEFCAMAVRAMDKADQEPAQRGRTIYSDVRPDHWANGWINLASVITLGAGSDGSGGTPLVSGVGDGTFQPNRAITYGEAVAILCRILGYSDVSTGANWYDGYLAAGASNGLTDGLTLSGGDVITRAQAAALFYNLYFTDPKGSKTNYLVSVLGGKEVEGGVVLDVDATADDGTTGAFQTTQGTYKTDRVFDPSLEGQEGKVLLDSDGKLLAFQPKENTSSRVVNVISAQATYLTASGGEKIDVKSDAVVYQDGKATTWEKVYLDLVTPASVTFHYGANGKLSYLFFPSASSDGVTSMVARSTPNGSTNPFASLASGGTYTMFKNGVSATAGDIRRYDVATYDEGTRVIQVSDLKLTGVYEQVSPSPAAPITVTVMGKTFPVLSSARNDLASFKIGDKITLLLTTDGQVAGAVGAGVVNARAVGLASVSAGDGGASATVKLLQGGFEVKGTVSSDAVDRCNNQLVTVTSSAAGRLILQPISGAAPKADLDVAARKLGDRDVAENVVVYDRVKDGAMVAVDYDDLSTAKIARSKIDFVEYDYAGKVKYLILADATGDAYQYGYLSYTSPVETVTSGGDLGDNVDITPATLCVKQGGKDGGDGVYTAKGEYSGSLRGSAPGGVAYAADGKVAAAVKLQSLPNVSRSAYDAEEMTVTVAGVSYPISNKVQCYNKTTKTWFPEGKDGLAAARAYADAATLYYDRAPDQGGKIRLIVVE